MHVRLREFLLVCAYFSMSMPIVGHMHAFVSEAEKLSLVSLSVFYMDRRMNEATEVQSLLWGCVDTFKMALKQRLLKLRICVLHLFYA